MVFFFLPISSILRDRKRLECIPNAYVQHLDYAEAGQPYGAGSYIQPQPDHNYDPQNTTTQTTNATQPGTLQVVQQENPTSKQLNIAAAILSGILLVITIVGLIVGAVITHRYYGYRYYLPDTLKAVAILGGTGFGFLLIGMILSCVTAFGKNIGSSCKRGMLIGAIILYCVAGIVLLAWAWLGADFFGQWMYVFLVVAVGVAVLTVISGVSCNKYHSTTMFVRGGVPQGIVSGGGPQSLVIGGARPGQSLVIGGTRPGRRQPQHPVGGNPGYRRCAQPPFAMAANPEYPGYDQPQSAMAANRDYPGYDQAQSAMAASRDYPGYDQPPFMTSGGLDLEYPGYEQPGYYGV